MKLVLRSSAERELNEAAIWYERRQPELKERFLESVEDTLSRIEKSPQLYPIIHLDIRRVTLHRFPFGVYYTLIRDEIHILAVVHDARHPSVWRRRR